MSRLSVVGAFLAGVLLVAASVVVYGPGPDMPTLAEKKAMLKVAAQKQVLLLDEPYTTEQKPIKQILLLNDREKPIKQILLLNEAGTVFPIVCPRRSLSLAFPLLPCDLVRSYERMFLISFWIPVVSQSYCCSFIFYLSFASSF
jgi:hypothetical protein